MKIAVISIMEGHPWGGSEELWLNMAKEALLNHHNVLVSYKKWEKLPIKISHIKDLGAEIYLRESTTIFPSITKRIINKLRSKTTDIKKVNSYSIIFETRPDIIFINEGAFTSIFHFPDLYRLLLNHKIPYIILSHQNREFGSIDGGFYQTAKKIYLSAKKVFFVSERNRKMANILLAQDLKNSFVVKNPVNLSNLNDIPFPETTVIKMACVGRLYCKQKGQDLLLRSLAKLSADYNFIVTFYGAGEDESYLKELTNYLGLNKNVHFAGFEGDVRKIWSENQALVLTSHYEGMPLVVVESMLCARMVIVSDVAGHGEWVENGVDGFIIKCNTVESIVNSLTIAISKIHVWESMGEMAAVKARNLYDINSGKSLLNQLC